MMASHPLVLGIDQSTQGTKALLLDEQGHLIAKCSRPHQQIINEKGYVEHDLNEIYTNVCGVVADLIAQDPSYAQRITCVGLSVQRETVGAWRKSTLEPLYHAIVWQCGRGAAFVAQPEIKDAAPYIRETTGLELSEFFSAAKLAWLFDNVPEIRAAAEAGDLCVGNIDTFLVHKLTHGKTFATEPSNASRTQLMDIHKLAWDAKLCELFHVDTKALAPIWDSDSDFGSTDFEGVLPHPITIHAAIGDSQGALFGQGCLKSGQTKTTYGTGSSMISRSEIFTWERRIPICTVTFPFESGREWIVPVRFMLRTFTDSPSLKSLALYFFFCFAALTAASACVVFIFCLRRSRSFSISSGVSSDTISSYFSRIRCISSI